MSDLWKLSAEALAMGVARKAFSATEVVEAHLSRIDAINPDLNAIVKVFADEARREAIEADSKVAAGAALGPLHGVPFTIKANIDVAGDATTWGVPALSGAVAPVDAPIVARMRAAGAIAIGRTNLPDMALRMHTDSALYGLTLNPWNRSRTAGGSSGGEAVALAAGMSPIGLGNDLGGSLRNPASACGIASIRPSQGRVPHAGFVPAEDILLSLQLMNTDGPMARRVADVRLALRIIAGGHPRDPWSLEVPLDLPGGAAKPRVAMVAEPPGGPTEPVVAKVVRDAGAALKDAGYEVVEAVPPRYDEIPACWGQLLIGDFMAVSEQLRPLMGKDGGFFFDAAASGGSSLDAKAMSALFVLRFGLARAWSTFMAEHPLVLSPVWTQTPFEVGFDIASTENVDATLNLVRPVLPSNLFGLPSACVNAGRDPETGLPIGVLVTGRRLRDLECLDAAEAIESRLAVSTPIDPI